MRKSLLLFIFASCLFNSCDDTFTNDIITTHPNNPPSNRSAFDNYFDWDRINDIETINPFTPVSYTHLDVYKRQSRSSTLSRRTRTIWWGRYYCSRLKIIF